MALCAGRSLMWLVLFPHYKIHFRKKSTFIIAQTHAAVSRLLWETVMSGLCSEHMLPSHLQRSWHHHQTFMRGGKSVKDSVDSGIQNELTKVNGTHLHAPQTTNVYVGCCAGGRLKWAVCSEASCLTWAKQHKPYWTEYKPNSKKIGGCINSSGPMSE